MLLWLIHAALAYVVLLWRPEAALVSSCTQLNSAMEMEVEDVNAHYSRSDAVELLAQLQRHHAHALQGKGLGLLAAVKPLHLS